MRWERDKRIRSIEARLGATTGGWDGEWFWDSYSSIAAAVDKGHPLDDALEDEPGIARVARIEDHPAYSESGDELAHHQPRANAEFIAEAKADIRWLLGELARERERSFELFTKLHYPEAARDSYGAGGEKYSNGEG